MPFVRLLLGLETQETGLWLGDYGHRQAKTECRGVGW